MIRRDTACCVPALRVLMEKDLSGTSHSAGSRSRSHSLCDNAPGWALHTDTDAPCMRFVTQETLTSEAMHFLFIWHE